MTVFGNVLYSVPVCGLFNHEGRDNTWENNIIVDAPGFQVSSGNYPDLDQQSYSYIKALREKGGYDVYLRHYPELASLTDRPATTHSLRPGEVRTQHPLLHAGRRQDDAGSQQGCLGGRAVRLDVLGPAAAFGGFAFDDNCLYAPPELPLKFSLALRPDASKLLSWDEWRATGKDQNSVLADPMFVNPAKHDFRLKPDSPALKLGFKPIPIDRIGPYQDDLRASWPVVEAPGANVLGNFITEQYFQLPQATNR